MSNKKLEAALTEKAITAPGKVEEDRWVVTIPPECREWVPVTNMATSHPHLEKGSADKDPDLVKAFFKKWIVGHCPSRTAAMPNSKDVWTYSFPTQADAEKFSNHWCTRKLADVSEFDQTSDVVREIIE